MKEIHKVIRGKSCVLFESSDYVKIIDYLWMKRENLLLQSIKIDYSYDVPSAKIVAYFVAETP